MQVLIIEVQTDDVNKKKSNLAILLFSFK